MFPEDWRRILQGTLSTMWNRILLVSGLAVLVAALGGCETIPENYRRDFLPIPNAGYRIAAESASGFDLEVYYVKRGILLKRDDLVADAKSTYVQIATWLSSRIGRAPRNISKQDLDVRFNRRLMDGLHEVYVIGTVAYR